MQQNVWQRKAQRTRRQGVQAPGPQSGLNRSRWLAGLLGGAALLLYGITAAPSIVALYDDSLEFQLVVPTFGIPHPTGYPLYVLLGGLWSRLLLPVGNWAWRVNLFSGLAGAGAVALLFLLARRLLGTEPGLRSLLAGVTVALAFALSPVWWSQATLAEVYALHGLFVAAILLTGVAALQAPAQEGSDPPRLTPLFLLLGLSLTHHRTTLLLLPGLALALLWRFPGLWRPRRAWLPWFLALLLPLLLYAYIPIRAAMGVRDLRGDYVNSWSGFWDHVLARGYTGFFQDNPLAVARGPGEWLALFQAQFGWPLLLLGLLGLGLGLAGRRRPAWALMLLVGLTHLLFGLAYRVPDVEVFLIPAFLVLALGVGQASFSLAERVERRLPPGASSALGARRLAWALQALILLGALTGFGGRGPAVDRSQEWAVHDYAVAMAKVDFPPGSRVVGLEGQMTALKYMQAAEGLGRNAVPVVADDPALRRQLVARFMAQGLPVYLTQELAGIETLYSFSGEGPLVRVWPRGEAQPGRPTHPLERSFVEGALLLTGYDQAVLEQAGGPALELALYWQPTQPLERTFKLSFRFLDGEGQLLAQEDRFPLGQVYPSWAWLPGETVRDVHILSLPGDPRQQPLTLRVILYDTATGQEFGRWQQPLP